MVALLLFFPWRLSRNVANPFSSVMVRMSAPVLVISPLLSHTDRKPTRDGRLSKMVPITWCFFHYMVPLHDAVKAVAGNGGSGKTDYRNQVVLENSNVAQLASHLYLSVHPLSQE